MDGERIEGDWVSDGEGASFVGDRGGDLTRVDLLWGVDVSWKRGLVFNARIESALSGSGLWSEAVENGRCIVPVRAFYETRNVDGGTGGRKPQYRFASAGGTALLLAGLRLGDRFVLVTCEPDAVVGRVHSRMPLSLTAPEALAWLDRSTDARDLLARHAPVPLESQEESAPPTVPPTPTKCRCSNRSGRGLMRGARRCATSWSRESGPPLPWERPFPRAPIGGSIPGPCCE